MKFKDSIFQLCGYNVTFDTAVLKQISSQFPRKGVFVQTRDERQVEFDLKFLLKESEERLWEQAVAIERNSRQK